MKTAMDDDGERPRTAAEFVRALVWRGDMTLGTAMKIRRSTGWACACCGPPVPSPRGTPCYCALTNIQVESLHRAAHIVVKLVGSATDGSAT